MVRSRLEVEVGVGVEGREIELRAGRTVERTEIDASLLFFDRTEEYGMLPFPDLDSPRKFAQDSISLSLSLCLDESAIASIVTS